MAAICGWNRRPGGGPGSASGCPERNWLKRSESRRDYATLVIVLAPSTPAELAEGLRDAASAGQTIALFGNSTKRRMAGPVEPADVAVTTVSLRGVLQYEPRDLTISVSAGVSWRELTR